MSKIEINIQNGGKQSFLESSSSSNSNEFFNIKLGARPVKFYKLILIEKNKINDYKYIIEKIKKVNELNSDDIILYLKINPNSEFLIENENDWLNFFEKNSLIEIVDSKSTLKIEYSLDKSKKSLNESQAKIIKDDIDKSSFEVIKSIFSQVLTNDQLKNKIKADLVNNLYRDNKDALILKNQKYFDKVVSKILFQSLEKLKNLQNLKTFDFEEDESSNLLNSSLESEIILKDENNASIPSFSEYYKNELSSEYRSNLISKSYTFNNINNKEN